jgi:hypothetical protein
VKDIDSEKRCQFGGIAEYWPAVYREELTTQTRRRIEVDDASIQLVDTGNKEWPLDQQSNDCAHV